MATILGRLEAAQRFYAAGLPLSSTIDDPWVRWLGAQNFAIYNWVRGDVGTGIKPDCSHRVMLRCPLSVRGRSREQCSRCRRRAEISSAEPDS